MITGSADKTLILWDTETWGKVRRFFGHAGPISDVAMNRNGSLAVSVSHFDRTIMLWSMDQDRPLAVFPCADVPTCVSVGGTDKPIVMVGFAGGQVQFFSLESK
jgi:WD40 repeat protein